MNLDSYPVISSDDLLTHTFVSEGPKGKIEKHISFQTIGRNCFNLAFGDWVDERKSINDKNRSNNLDREKVLSTVANTVQAFMLRYPMSRIFVRGSTQARTRLYQMRLLSYLHEINKDFLLEGFHENEWETFQPNNNYSSFSLTKK
ncbi:DUF6934 family protein [Chitinophaga caseinilytica]|uniref:Uncharacterized protein n=1 Tax=Chitinophaga caseinilytica TaxID=2267521 RepID=A0ABZ2Z8D1_9BACT